MKKNGAEIGWRFFSCLAFSMLSAQAMGNEEVSRKIIYMHQNSINGRNTLTSRCSAIHDYIGNASAIEKCFSPQSQDETARQDCAVHRKTLNILNWGHASPSADELKESSGIAFGLDKLWKDFGLEQNQPKISYQATNANADSARFDALNPRDGVPENFMVQSKSTFWIRSALHACDWLKGDLKLSFDAQVETGPESLNERVLSDAWSVYEITRNLKTSLSDSRLKALLQSYVLLTGLPKEIETAFGSKEQLIQFFFVEQDDGIALVQFESPKILQERFLEKAPKGKSTKTIVLEPKQ